MNSDSKAMTGDQPPFVFSQGMRLLLETGRPREYLRAEYFRAGRVGRAGGSVAEQRADAWVAVDRLDVAHNRLALPEGRACDLARLVITTDAGVGKTTAMRWLQAELNGAVCNGLAVLLNFHQLPARTEDWLAGALLPQLRYAAGNAASVLPDERALRALKLLKREGRLVLLLDALDQAPPDGAAVSALCRLLKDPDWQRCRIIVSGRPHALQRHWAELFDGSAGCGWRFAAPGYEHAGGRPRVRGQ